MATLVKIQDAQPMGEYVVTAIDFAKKAVDFRLVDLNYIVWNDGRGEQVTRRKLKVLQAQYSWTTDF